MGDGRRHGLVRKRGTGSGHDNPNSVLRNSDTFGVLKLTLHPNGYTWKFVS